MEIRVTSFEGELSGNTMSLRTVILLISNFLLTEECELTIAADAVSDPAPYEQSLARLIVQKGEGPALVKVEADALVLQGSVDNIDRFTSFLQFAVASPQGGHSHFEAFPGNRYVHENSLPLVVAKREPAQ